MNKFDNWKAGLTVGQFWVFASETSCEFCPAENTCIGVSSCFDEFRRWAESEYIPPKAKSPFKPGDKVKVREDLEVGKDYGNFDVHFCEGMAQYKGRTVTIKEEHAPGWYRIEEDKDGGWPHTFCAEMLLPAEKSKDEQLADLLGVEVGEKFNLRRVSEGNVLALGPYRLTGNWQIETKNGEIHYSKLGEILSGNLLIEKIPQQPEAWKPKERREPYWRVCADGHIQKNYWMDDALGLSLYAIGSIFPTKEAAEAGKADVMAKFEAIKAELGE